MEPQSVAMRTIGWTSTADLAPKFDTLGTLEKQGWDEATVLVPG